MLTINISELILTVINFFLLYFLLNRFLYKPIIKFMDERQARIDAGAQKTRDARDAVRENEELMETQLSESRTQAGKIIADAHAADEAAHAKLGEKLRESRLRAMQENKEHVDELCAAERAELEEKRGELTSLLVSRLLGETENV